MLKWYCKYSQVICNVTYYYSLQVTMRNECKFPEGRHCGFSFLTPSACSVICTTFSLAHSPFPGYPDTFFDPQLCQAHSCLWVITFVVSSAWKFPSHTFLRMIVSYSSDINSDVPSTEKPFLDLWILSLCPNHSQGHLMSPEIIYYLSIYWQPLLCLE